MCLRDSYEILLTGECEKKVGDPPLEHAAAFYGCSTTGDSCALSSRRGWQNE